jgi:hypothetical protein
MFSNSCQSQEGGRVCYDDTNFHRHQNLTSITSLFFAHSETSFTSAYNSGYVTALCILIFGF